MAENDKTYVISWLMPTEEQIREQMRTALEGPRVICYFSGYPPLPDERTYAYQYRVMPLLMRDAFPPKQSLWQRFRAALSIRPADEA